MIWICSSTFLMASCALSRIIEKFSFNLCSKLSACCISYFVSRFTCSTTSSRESLPFLVFYNYVTSVLACDCTSCGTLTCNLYSAFVGIFANTNCTCARYLSGVWAMDSSICKIFDVSGKLGFDCTMVWMVSSLFGVILSFAFVAGGVGYVPLS
jgi:hypothetical protein